MVSKINHGSNLYGALSYNQEKVDKGLGKILACNLVMEPADGRFTAYSCMEDFERFMPSHIRTSKPVVHISLNPHPDDKLTDEQLSDIGWEYLDRLGYGKQPFMIFKHEDIGREHIHLVTTRVRIDGSLVPDKFEKDRSNKIVQALEKEYNLIPAKGQKQGEVWRLSPVDVSAGNLKKQVANTINSLSIMYTFRTLSQYRALLSIYNIGIEEVKGENKGNPYRGLVYSALDGEGNRVGKPLKSSLFGKQYGINGLEQLMTKSGEIIKTKGLTVETKKIITASLAESRNGNEFQAKLQEKGINLVLRRNDQGRIYGVTFIDHNSRTVLNGSALGKEFSTNALSERFSDFSLSSSENLLTTPSVLLYNDQHSVIQTVQDNWQQILQPIKNDPQPQVTIDHSGDNSSVGSLLSVLTPESDPHDNNQSIPKPKKKKKRKYGRQM